MTESDVYLPEEFNAYQPSLAEKIVNGTIKFMFFLMVVGALALVGSIIFLFWWLPLILR